MLQPQDLRQCWEIGYGKSNDKRYKNIGRTIDLLSNYKIPIFADNYVDMSFGTGCVKVTDSDQTILKWQIGGLEIKSIMNEDGTS